MCLHPMWRIPVKKHHVQFLFKDKELSGYNSTNGAFIIPQSNHPKYEGVMSVLSLSPQALRYAEENVAVVPCGKCLECKLKASKEWAQRSIAESREHASNWFVTLTYDNEHIPEPELTFSRHNYEFGLWSPLLYEDFQLFKKRLLERMRDQFGVTGIRFMMCGEYGPNTGRPHFHVIFYGLPLPDIEKYSETCLSGKRYVYLTSKLVEECWSKGFITIGEVNWETSAYVGRYVLKKLSNLEEYDYCKLCYDNGVEPLPPEMREASRRPGLGKPYYDQYKESIYKTDTVVMPDGRTAKPCSYFDRLYDLENPELLELIKSKRKAKAQILNANLESRFETTDQLNEYKLKKYEKLCRSVSKLKRPL